MKKIIFLICALVCSFVFAQQKFFEFAAKGSYGIVDINGNEIVEPRFERINYVPDSADYILLISDEKALTCNRFTGKQEYFQKVSGPYIDDLNGKSYFYGIKDNKSFLMNALKTSERLPLFKMYDEVHQIGNFLVAYNSGHQNFVVLNPDSRKPVKTAVPGGYVRELRANHTTFAVNEQSRTCFYDGNFNKITCSTKLLENEDQIDEFLRKLPDPIITDTSAVEENARVESDWLNPRVKVMMLQNKRTVGLLYDEKSFEPIATMDGNDRLTISGFNNSVELDKITDDSDAAKELFFYISAITKKILLPKKYNALYGITEIPIEQRKCVPFSLRRK